MGSRIQQTNGFTLIELLLYVALMSIMMLAMTAFLSMLLQARIKNQAILEVDQQGLAAAQFITQAIRNADSITTPTIGASGSTLTLAVAAPNNPTTFSVASGVLQVSEAGGAGVALTNGRVVVSGLTVSNLSRSGTPGGVQVQFTITHVNPSGRNEYDVSRTFTAGGALRFP